MKDAHKLSEIYEGVDYRNLRPLEIQLQPFQIPFVEKSIDILGRCSPILINTSDTGTGKTIMTISLIKEFDAFPIVICPGTGKDDNKGKLSKMWQTQFRIYGIDDYKIVSYNSLGARTKKDEINTVVVEDFLHIKSEKIGNKKEVTILEETYPSIVRLLKSSGKECLFLIYDEFHSIKNENSSRGVLSRSLITEVINGEYFIKKRIDPRLILLSATPYSKAEDLPIFFENISFKKQGSGKSTSQVEFERISNNCINLFKNLMIEEGKSDKPDREILKEYSLRIKEIEKYKKEHSSKTKGLNAYLPFYYSLILKYIGVSIGYEDVEKDTDISAFNGKKNYKRNGFFKLPDRSVNKVKELIEELANLPKGDIFKRLNSINAEIQRASIPMYARIAFEKLLRRNRHGVFDKIIFGLYSPEDTVTLKNEILCYHSIVKIIKNIVEKNLSVEQSYDQIKNFSITNTTIDISEDMQELLLAYIRKFEKGSYKFDPSKLIKTESNIQKYLINNFNKTPTEKIMEVLLKSFGKYYMIDTEFAIICISLTFYFLPKIPSKLVQRAIDLAKNLYRDNKYRDVIPEIKIGIVNGIEKQKDREEDIKNFNSDKDYRALIVTTQSTAEGISLQNTKVDDEERYVFIAPLYDTIKMAQLSGRIYRVGVRGDCYTYTVYGKQLGTAQKKIFEKVARDSDYFEGSIGDKRRKASPGSWDNYCENDDGKMLPANEAEGECEGKL